MKSPIKTTIYYHRSYRKVIGSFGEFFVECLTILLPICVCVYLLFSKMTEILCEIGVLVLSPWYPKYSVYAVQSEFLFQHPYYLIAPGKFPSATFSFMNAVVFFALIVLCSRINLAKPLAHFGIVFSTINLVSSIFFLFLPSAFPYEIFDFADVFMKAQISIWIFIPIIMGLAVLPYPTSILSKIAIVIFTVIYSFVFGMIRFPVFLFILGKFSFLYMAALFFLFGPLMDYIYIVGIYSVFTTKMAIRLKNDLEFWQWLY